MDNMDKIVEMCRGAVADIIRSVGGVGNLLVNENKMALVQSIADRLTQLGADVETILGSELANAYFQGITDADAFMQTQGVDTSVNGVNKQVHLAGVQSIVADSMQDMNASFRTALIMGIADIDGILESVNADIAKGMILGDPSDYTARMVEQTFAQNGMTSFITSDGKRLPLDFYAQTVTRTKYRTAHTTGAVNRYKESGVYHVKINEHHPTCKVCARYQGMVVALDEEHADGFPTDIPLPPYHPNCQHVARPYVMDYHSETDIRNERKKWDQFDPDSDPRTDAQRNLYKNEQDIRRKARQELKEFQMMQATMPDKAPKTIGAYRRAKRKDDEKWKALQEEYKKNLGIAVDGSPPPPGTPKKKRGSARGAKGTKPPKPKSPPKSPPKKKASDKVDTPKITTPPPVDTVDTSPGLKLTDADKKAHQEFDRIIDGIEFGNIKKTAQHILDRSQWTGDLKASVRSNIGSAGYCSSFTLFNKFHVTEYVLEKKSFAVEEYNIQTVFHEFFHANLHGLTMPHKTGTEYAFAGKRWTSLEETATETAGIFMTNRAGYNYNGKTPAYSEHLIENLPRIKQLPEFKDCESLEDFGAVFMKYRFDPEHRTGDWKPFDDRLSSIPPHNQKEYVKKHYKEWILANKEIVSQEILDILPQEKAGRENQFKRLIWEDVESGAHNDDLNNSWYRTAVGLAMNTIGVKMP